MAQTVNFLSVTQTVNLNPINEFTVTDNESDHSSIIYHTDLDDVDTPRNHFNGQSVVETITSFLSCIKSSTCPLTPLSSLLLFIKQMNESIVDLMKYPDITLDDECNDILRFLSSFNDRIISHLAKQQNSNFIPSLETNGIAGTVSSTFNAAVPLDDDDDEKTTNEPALQLTSVSAPIDAEMEMLKDRTVAFHAIEAIAADPLTMATTGDVADDEDETEIEDVQEDVRGDVREDESEAKVREEIKRRNIDENFNFFESFFVLKQESFYRSQSERHQRGRLALKHISRMQLLRLICNIVSRWEDGTVSHPELMDILKNVFAAKLNGKRFQTVSYSRFKQIVGTDSDDESNIIWFIYQSVKMYFEANAKSSGDAERKYQGLNLGIMSIH